MSATAGETISVKCDCGKKLKAPSTAIGKKAKCPACGNVLTIAPPPPPPPVEDDPLNALYDLADAEQSAAQSNQVDDSPRCPKCGSDMGTGAVLCVNCGFDMRSGKKAAAATESAPPVPALQAAGQGSKQPLGYGRGEKAPRADAGDGNYFMGVVWGVLFALGGGLVYGVIKYFLGGVPFMGWLAGWAVLMVGFLAGKGVDRGYKGGNLVAGLTAAGITLVIVIFTHVAVFAATVAPMVKEAMDEAASERETEGITLMLAQEELKKKNIEPRAATMEQHFAAEAAVEKRVKSLSDSEYTALKAKADVFKERSDLAEYVKDDLLKEKKIDPEEAPETEERAAYAMADKRIAEMSDSTVADKLKAAIAKADKDEEAEDAKAEAEEAAAAKKTGGSSSNKGGSGIGGSIIGFAIIMGLLFLIWLYFPVVVAMVLAYKVAANA